MHNKLNELSQEWLLPDTNGIVLRNKEYQAHVLGLDIGHYPTAFEAMASRDEYVSKYNSATTMCFPPVKNRAPVVVFMGMQGAGKDTWCNEFISFLIDLKVPFNVSGIKSTFKEFTNHIIDNLSDDYNISELAKKDLLLRISTWGEEMIDQNIWSNKYLDYLIDCNRISIASDIRTQMNLDALSKASKIRKVIMFNMTASEETRRKRIPNTFRENGGYTELGLTKDQISGENIHWFDIDTECAKEEILPKIINNFLNCLGLENE